ncbi:hypothetical protein [Streptomyces sp. YGL11-2]|uniref:hypothetical protein n=1 Tax=Streptomyces sp. YGL11-2 TaxID=3414028 RepID=UPI003CEE2734
MTGFIREIVGVFHSGRRPGAERGHPLAGRPHNLFEAAACYVAAAAEEDEECAAQAAAWVSPEALAFGVNELACRAVIALARERAQSPREVAYELLGLPVS